MPPARNPARGEESVNSIQEFRQAPLHLSALADAKWRAICGHVRHSWEVYALLLSRPGEHSEIADLDLPRQSVSGARCMVKGLDLLPAADRAASKGLLVAGSIHRHPGGGSWLSGTDRDLLDAMAVELASELAVPIRVVRRPRELVVRVGESPAVGSQLGNHLEPGVYSAANAEIEETILGARVYCLVWSARDGYGGAVGNVIYDQLHGTPRRDFRYLTHITVEQPEGKVRINHGQIKRLAGRLVKGYSYTAADPHRNRGEYVTH